MNVLLLQIDTKWQSPEENRRHIETLISAETQTDLIVLPEMFTTGFCISPHEVAEKAGTVTPEWMRNVAMAKNAAIAGSIVVEENGNFYNRLYFATPDGKYASYDKRHLFSFAGEHAGYTAGTKKIIISFRGVRILLQICYDLRFPVFSRNINDYDMIIYVANWPVPRVGAWRSLLTARAIENQCYVAGVNRTGSDPATKYSGGSVLLDFIGKPVAEAVSDSEEAVSGNIDIARLNSFRQKFPALNDADRFTLCIEP
ncbi:MAG: amidohydrolase [Prevotellaceae bacterium]|jgi:predicted amidohydrolase|nr:amidohydrolase [Prevotellaceae bacterium]